MVNGVVYFKDGVLMIYTETLIRTAYKYAVLTML